MKSAGRFILLMPLIGLIALGCRTAKPDPRPLQVEEWTAPPTDKRYDQPPIYPEEKATLQPKKTSAGTPSFGGLRGASMGAGQGMGMGAGGAPF